MTVKEIGCELQTIRLNGNYIFLEGGRGEATWERGNEQYDARYTQHPMVMNNMMHGTHNVKW